MPSGLQRNAKKIVLVTVAFIVIVLISNSILIWNGPYSSWDIETVADQNVWSGGPMVLDSRENPHVVYVSNSYVLRYGERTNNGWFFESVDQSGVVGHLFSFALDSDDHPIIVYKLRETYSSSSELRYARWTGTNWMFDTIGECGIGGVSLALDAEDNPHIVYHEDTRTLQYATLADSTWSIETILIDNLGPDSFMALDNRSNPHVIYETNIEPTTLRYAHLDNGIWTFETVDSGGNYADPSMVFDSNDLLHLSYWDWSPSMLKYATRVNGNWTSMIVDDDGGNFAGSSTSITVDGNNDPHISYKGHERIMYVRWEDQDWRFDTVDYNDFTGYGTSIVIDRYGNPHVTFCDLMGTMYYARFEDTDADSDGVGDRSDPLPEFNNYLVYVTIIYAVVIIVIIISIKRFDRKREKGDKNPNE